MAAGGAAALTTKGGKIPARAEDASAENGAEGVDDARGLKEFIRAVLPSMLQSAVKDAVRDAFVLFKEEQKESLGMAFDKVKSAYDEMDAKLGETRGELDAATVKLTALEEDVKQRLAAIEILGLADEHKAREDDKKERQKARERMLKLVEELPDRVCKIMQESLTAAVGEEGGDGRVTPIQALRQSFKDLILAEVQGVVPAHMADQVQGAASGVGSSTAGDAANRSRANMERAMVEILGEKSGTAQEAVTSIAQAAISGYRIVSRIQKLEEAVGELREAAEEGREEQAKATQEFVALRADLTEKLAMAESKLQADMAVAESKLQADIEEVRRQLPGRQQRDGAAGVVVTPLVSFPHPALTGDIGTPTAAEAATGAFRLTCPAYVPGEGEPVTAANITQNPQIVAILFAVIDVITERRKWPSNLMEHLGTRVLEALNHFRVSVGAGALVNPTQESVGRALFQVFEQKGPDPGVLLDLASKVRPAREFKYFPPTGEVNKDSVMAAMQVFLSTVEMWLRVMGAAKHRTILQKTAAISVILGELPEGFREMMGYYAGWNTRPHGCNGLAFRPGFTMETLRNNILGCIEAAFQPEDSGGWPQKSLRRVFGKGHHNNNSSGAANDGGAWAERRNNAQRGGHAAGGGGAAQGASWNEGRGDSGVRTHGGGRGDRGRSSAGYGDRVRNSASYGDRGRSSAGYGDRGRSSAGYGDRGRSSVGYGGGGARGRSHSGDPRRGDRRGASQDPGSRGGDGDERPCINCGTRGHLIADCHAPCRRKDDCTFDGCTLRHPRDGGGAAGGGGGSGGGAGGQPQRSGRR